MRSTDYASATCGSRGVAAALPQLQERAPGFIIGATDGVIPDHRAFTTEQKFEERNALYVAITRSSSTLTILHAPQTIMKRHKQYEKVDRLSQFLNHKSVLKYLTKEQSAESLAKVSNG